MAGYHTEYSSMKFAMFFMAEYINMVTSSALMVALFLGGWHLPGLERLLSGNALALAHAGVFVAKVAGLLFVFIWVRWTLPRFRYDQLMRIGWRVLLPLAFVNVCIVAVLLLWPLVGARAPAPAGQTRPSSLKSAGGPAAVLLPQGTLAVARRACCAPHSSLRGRWSVAPRCRPAAPLLAKGPSGANKTAGLLGCVVRPGGACVFPRGLTKEGSGLGLPHEQRTKRREPTTERANRARRARGSVPKETHRTPPVSR